MSDDILTRTCYYHILSVPRGASVESIKTSYKKLAKKYHPDRNDGAASAAAAFVKIKEAYDILTDPVKKGTYDEAIRIVDDRKLNRSAFARSTSIQPPQQLDVYISLEQAYGGCTVETRYNLICHSCYYRKCVACNGTRKISTSTMKGGKKQLNYTPCFACKTCYDCLDTHIVTKTNNMYIEPGVRDGSKHYVDNVTFVIHISPHEHYRIVGDDLTTTLRITLLEAIVGFAYEVNHPSGKSFLFKKDQFQGDEALIVMDSYGMPIVANKANPSPRRYGNLFIKLEIIWPARRHFSPEGAEAMKEVLYMNSSAEEDENKKGLARLH